MHAFLEANPKNVCVVHCTVSLFGNIDDATSSARLAAFISAIVFVSQDGKASSAVLVCAFLIYMKLFERPEDAAQLFAVRRTPPGLQPSEMR